MHHYVTGTDSKSVLIRADYGESLTWGFHCNCGIGSLKMEDTAIQDIVCQTLGVWSARRQV